MPLLAMEAVFAAGGHIVLSAGTYGGVLGTFLDPAGGNLMGIYRQPGLAEAETAKDAF